MAQEDDLYVEIKYTPNSWDAFERWSARLCSENPRDYSVGGVAYGPFEWWARLAGHRLLAKKRKERRLQQRAKEYGKKIIR